jgi:putative molybdopterin biosynthesis protein
MVGVGQNHERNIYLHDVALDEALAAWHSALARHGLLAPLGTEVVPLTAALGRVTAEPVWARISSPHYHAAAMDGYAVRSDDTRGATETAPLFLRVGEQARPVDTGDPLPPGMNAVIMIEQTQPVQRDGVDCIEILEATRRGATCAPWARTWWPASWCCPATTGCGPRTWARWPAAATPQ